MERIFCEIHLFDLYQTIYTFDPETGVKTVRGRTTMEELPSAITALSNETKYRKVLLTGNNILASAVAEDIVEYSKRHYDWTDHEIEVEVLK